MPLVSKQRFGSAAVAPVLVGAWGAAISLAPGPVEKLLLTAPPFLTGAAWWTMLTPERWLAIFFFCCLLLPPLPIPLGNSGVHIAPAAALVGFFAGIIRMRSWRSWQDPLPQLFGIFLAILAGSTAFAALYSGFSIALGSAARVLLFSLAVYVFVYTFAGPRSRGYDPIPFTRLLFRMAMLAALFACADFYFQFPAPAGFGPQFVWLEQGVFRRAQGLFYEASTLGNFCAFFLVMILVAAFRTRDERICSRLVLAVGGVLFGAALIFSSSRASLLTVVVAGCALIYVRRLRIGRALFALSASLIAAALVVRAALPAFSSHYWTRIEASIQYLGSSPDGVLSGRVASWNAITGFLITQPWHALFGIGYKTLPYTSYVGAGLVADNAYLSLLVETGIFGLIAFLLLNAGILRASFRAARSLSSEASFFGTWIFCFWCGELVQMLSGDLITYWRVLPVYFWVLATAVRASEEYDGRMKIAG
jgi:O-antigen ligase